MTHMKILIVGAGGREHALAWKTAQSDKVDIVYVAPGNAGTETEPGIENVSIDVEDIAGLTTFAKENAIDLTIIGPEMPLVLGIVDAFREENLPCFGPTKAAAILEGSKSFSKDFLKRHNIPSAGYETFSDLDQAISYIKAKGAPIVIKADGLAAGKGVIVAENEQQAIDAVSDMLSGNKFGEAGHLVVIEEFLSGEEASFIVMCDGTNILPLASSQDHKARDEGDMGPNTGGMGAYSPAPVVDDALYHRIMKEIIQPTVSGMATEGRPYTGFLYAGLMIAPDGTIRTLEFNCRFGDPETQAIIMRLKSDLTELCLAAVNGELDSVEAEWDPRACLGVVMASAGYPESASKGDIINGLDRDYPEHTKVFHAGTASHDGNVITAGGRVLCVTGMADTVSSAQHLVYDAINLIDCDALFYRKDIGYRAVDRETNS
jgi:phosphoribosylamine--glycine ligase